MAASPRNPKPDAQKFRAEEGVPLSMRRLADEHLAEHRDHASRHWAALLPGGPVSARLACDVTQHAARERREIEGGSPTGGH
jgi:hypothetical protein